MGLPTSLLLAAALTQGPASPDDQAVSTYAPDFFSASRPANAMDMINRLPGFSFDGGGNVRGLSGAAGNVLIDGRRPASKSDALSDVLGRVPANQVLRVDVIRGGAPGIDRPFLSRNRCRTISACCSNPYRCNVQPGRML